MAPLVLEVVEGPDAGKRISVAAPVVIGRDDASGLALAEPQVSRSHARVSPSGDAVIVEDLGSTNGTFVNGDEVHAPTRVGAGDQILVGTSVLLVRTEQQVVAQPSAVRPVPPALAVSPRPPDYIPAGIVTTAAEGEDDLARYLDARTKAKARIAPLALVLLAVLVVIVYLAVWR